MFNNISEKLKKGAKAILLLPKTPYNIAKLLNNTTNLTKRIDDIFYNMQVLTMLQAFHSNTFPRFKGIHTGESVVIIASGPTAAQYQAIPGAIHVAINLSFLMKKINFDYLFVNDCSTDNNHNEKYYDKSIENTIKFFGILPQRRLSQLPTLTCMQPRILNLKNSFPYLLEDIWSNKFAIHLECEPFGDFGGTVFSALQFVLYTNPSRIYLVGCDCDCSHHFYDNKSSNTVADHSAQYASYLKFSKFVKLVYPDTKVYSINPVKLKGIFNDIYM